RAPSASRTGGTAARLPCGLSPRGRWRPCRNLLHAQCASGTRRACPPAGLAKAGAPSAQLCQLLVDLVDAGEGGVGLLERVEAPLRGRLVPGFRLQPAHLVERPRLTG